MATARFKSLPKARRASDSKDARVSTGIDDIPQMMSSERFLVDRNLMTSAGRLACSGASAAPGADGVSVARLSRATYLGHFSA